MRCSHSMQAYKKFSNRHGILTWFSWLFVLMNPKTTLNISNNFYYFIFHTAQVECIIWHMAVILENFIINNFHILSYLILMYCHNLRAKEIHCEFDRKKTKNTHFNRTRYKNKTNQYGVRLRWYLIKGRASPACY